MFRKSVSIDLVEPTVCLRGDSKDKHTVNILRGVVRLRLPHSIMVHSIVVQFVGVSKTLWPEAFQQWDKHILVDTVIPICKNSILLKKGIHNFPFEIPLSNALAESIECGLGSVRYKLNCRVHVKPRFLLIKSTLQTQRSIVLVRLPSLENQQQCIIQTHLINENGGHLMLMLERAHLVPGASVPISMYFNQQCHVLAVDQMDVKLIERQKYRAPLKQTTRIVHHEITLSPFANSTFEMDRYNSELRSIYTLPEKTSMKLRASTSHTHIRVRHWIQITLTLLLNDGSSKELQMDAPVTVSLLSMDDYLTLPVYDRQQHHMIERNSLQDTHSNNATAAASSPLMTESSLNTEGSDQQIINEANSIGSSSFSFDNLRRNSSIIFQKLRPASTATTSSSQSGSTIDYCCKNRKSLEFSSSIMTLLTAPPPSYENSSIYAQQYSQQD